MASGHKQNVKNEELEVHCYHVMILIATQQLTWTKDGRRISSLVGLTASQRYTRLHLFVCWLPVTASVLAVAFRTNVHLRCA